MNRYEILKHPERELCTSEQANIREFEKTFARIRGGSGAPCPLYFAVGGGSWAGGGISPHDRLAKEIYRKAVSMDDAVFIDHETGEPVPYPTNTVDFTATFSENEAFGLLTETGLFSDGTDEPGSGKMISYRTFPVVNKNGNTTMTLTLRVTA